jgi:hypothetical protein
MFKEIKDNLLQVNLLNQSIIGHVLWTNRTSIKKI